jgi:uncharacterized membrane protein
MFNNIPADTRPYAYRLGVISLIGLLFWCLAWELWLAPLRVGGSSLALKALPLLFPLMGILKQRMYTWQWSSLFIWLYMTEGLVRAFSDAPAQRWLAWVEVALCSLFFIATLWWIKAKPKNTPLSDIPQST